MVMVSHKKNSSKYMVCQSPVVYKETPKVVDKIDLNFGFDYMGNLRAIPNGLAPRYVSEMIRHGGDPMLFFMNVGMICITESVTIVV